MDKDYVILGNSNDRLNKFPSTNSQYSYVTRPNTENQNKPTTSAKHGRRSLIYQNEIGGSYIVPKMDDIDFKEIIRTQEEPFIFKPIYRKPEDNASVQSNSNQQTYSPSILEQSCGRRSRLELVDDQVSSLSCIKDLNITNSQISRKPEFNSTTHFKSKSVPETDTYYLQPDFSPSKTTFQETFVLIPEFNSNILKERKIFQSLNLDDDDFLILKSKMDRRKGNHKKKIKHKSTQNLIAFRKQNSHNDLTESYKAQNVGDNHFVNGQDSDDVFIIPELPAGIIMIVDILSTWGDKYYVGLNGIELFDSDGNLVNVKKIFACPEDINILPECKGDPRVITNLLDGVNRTQDDTHLWLTPFDLGEHHLITMEFYKKTELAMMRIWNYNKSRIDSYRGARDVVITLNGICIFKGEIAQACGSILGGIESFGDTILFTTDEYILEKIAINDIAYSTLISVVDKEATEKIERPLTAAAGEEEVDQRPFTHAFSNKQELELEDQLFGVRQLSVALVSNWGKLDYIGLTGLEVIGDGDISITIPKENLRTDDITKSAMLLRIIDDENITTERKHMWYTKYEPNEEIFINILFDQCTYIAGIRIWNYNENLEMSYCGVQLLKIFLDGEQLINPTTNNNTFVVRRAPGNTHYDYVQEIRFCPNAMYRIHYEPFYNLTISAENNKNLHDSTIMPEGFVFEIVIYTTWGDQYYVGLNGLEMFDHLGRRIVLTESNICAHPESVNVLPGVSGDIRTPDKLINGINDRSDGTHSWLVPVIPKCLNRIYIVFDQPVTVSVIKIWNYQKTPSRGVKEFGILVDDLLVYNGVLDQISSKSSIKYRTILFTSNKEILQKEMASLVKHSIDSQTTVMMNDELRMTTGGSLPNADQSLRPFTTVNHLNRQRTSQSN